ncbi:5'-3' exonuclease H3TH domain-containing protein [Simiduia curdlanivorans]|uniref:5'-3' exonuclease H3TH domain-containing protein n=1 Tax=Simiduia curdlanivorans TaxID=1492769 RepID=A0ABV8V252_9GAMM|nr:5'-3' exonuclease H3TH domain-containing protein [Simiduia curdlanivorans]MDN3640163.1 5'-3' exonuclease H3TH domain-containing protein [Simiduia curdlanivorans]
MDASIYIFRAYFSLPPNWQSKSGYDTEAVYGFTNFLLDLRIGQPSHVAVCFDESLETGFRHRIYPEYKSSRALPDEALGFQLLMCQEVAAALGFSIFSSTEYEADDLIGSLLTSLHADLEPVAILSRDKDLSQLLLREQDYLWDYAANIRGFRPDVAEKFGVWPEQLVDYLALVGDASDDIPGVPGVGKKTAATLLANGRALSYWQLNPIELACVNVRGAKQLAAKISAYAEQISLAQRLAKIVCDIPLVASATALELKPMDIDLAQALFEQLGIKNLNKKLMRAHKLGSE